MATISLYAYTAANIGGSGVGDVLNGGNGNDSIYGSGGNDTADGGNGDDLVNGGNGNDLLQGGFNRDTLNGGNGNDRLYAYTAANIGGSGVGDILNGDSGNDSIYGSGGNDTVNGGNGNDLVNGGNGNDLLQGGFNRDTLNGGNGNDRLYAYTAANIGGSGVGDVLNGDSGNDFIYGSGGNDTLNGGSGNDNLQGGNGNDSLLGGSGNDILTGGGDGQIDVLTSGSLFDQDTFVLGTGFIFGQVLYDSAGNADYARITDFDLISFRGEPANEVDRIQLRGSASDYRLVNNPPIGGFTGVGIYDRNVIANPFDDDLIGLVQGVTAGTGFGQLNLTDTTQFTYVTGVIILP